jgi:hypothetical protein
VIGPAAGAALEVARGTGIHACRVFPGELKLDVGVEDLLAYGSIPGDLKNAVDWASRPFPDNAWRDKPVAVIGASTGIFGAVWAQAQLRTSLGIAGARVIDAELAVGAAHEAFLPSGALRDPNLATGLSRPRWPRESTGRSVSATSVGSSSTCPRNAEIVAAALA